MSNIKLQLERVEELLGCPALMIGSWNGFLVYTPKLGDELYVLADGENIRLATDEEAPKVAAECC